MTNRFILIEEDFTKAVDNAVSIYRNNGVFIYPTDTIYGIGGNPFSKEVVKKISALKGRGEEQKYILLADSLDTILKYAEINNLKIEFLKKIWPAPISVILPLKPDKKNELGTENSAFRIPAYKFCIELLTQLKMPLISTSVNRTGSAPMNDIENIRAEFGDEADKIFWTNQIKKTVASTLIDFSGNKPEVLREGEVRFREIEEKWKMVNGEEK